MRDTLITICSMVFVSCSTAPKFDIEEYHYLTNQAELQICKENFEAAEHTYSKAFKYIAKPFGCDVFNAALASEMAGHIQNRNQHLQTIINNSDDLNQAFSIFVEKYITEDTWDSLLAQKKSAYSPALRDEIENIGDRDQLFRPMYETHDDTINAIRIMNLNRILAITDSIGFPSQIELGYTESMRGQKHHIVLHHTAQRRSYDKSVLDLESLLFQAVHEGRLDPEKAMTYLKFQNDTQKGNFELFSTWQYFHPLLPDSLTNKIWLPNLTADQFQSANETRTYWFADRLEDIAIKAAFLSKTDLPFIFTSVQKSKVHLSSELDEEQALQQYSAFTSFMRPYQSLQPSIDF